MPLVAGVDSSTQSCKVVIRDALTGELIREGRSSHPDGTEIHPDAWLEALHEAIEAAGGLDGVEAISVGGQQHGMVVMDNSGNIIRPALLWNDVRSASEAQEIIDQFGAEDLAHRTGSVPVASFTSTKLRWLRNHEPEHATRVAAVALPHDWLTWRLAGYGPEGASEKGPDFSRLATDRSEASGTGYFNPETGDYLSDILEFCLGHLVTLPRIISPGDIAEKTPGGIILACGAGDNAAAALGIGASEGDVIVSLGTSGTVFAVSQTATHDPSGIIAGFASASGSALPLVCTMNAARVLDSYASLFDVTHEQFSDLALAAPPGANGVVLVPYFEGERTPNLPHATGELVGLTLENNTRENIARAAVEGMLCGLNAGLQAVLESGVTCNRIFMVGGAAASPAVQESAAQIFGVPITVVKPGEYVANGAATQAAHALLGTSPAWQRDILKEVHQPRIALITEQYSRAATVAAQR